LNGIRYTLSALKVIRTSSHPIKLNYTEDQLFLVIFFVQCIRFLTSLICFIVWFHVFISVLDCVLFLSFYAFAFLDFMYLLYNTYVCYILINDIHTFSGWNCFRMGLTYTRTGRWDGRLS